MGKFLVNQQELHGKMGLQRSLFGDSNVTTKIIRFRNRILDNLSFKKVDFFHDADFSHSSFVNATFIKCNFSYTCCYSFDGCDLENCTFMDLTGGSPGSRKGLLKFFNMIKNKRITFSDVKNLDQAKFDDERIKAAIKETFGL